MVGHIQASEFALSIWCWVIKVSSRNESKKEVAKNKSERHEEEEEEEEETLFPLSSL